MKKRKAFRRLLGYVGKHKFSLVLIVIFAVLSTAYLVLAPNVMGRITTMLFESVKTGEWDWKKLTGLLFFLLQVYVIASVFGVLTKFTMVRVSSRVMKSIRSDIDRKMHAMKLDYYDTHTHGEILSTITNDVDTLGTAIGDNLSELLSQLFQAIGILIMMFATNVWLALIVVVTVPITLLLTKGIISRGNKYYEKQQDLIGKLNGLIEEHYNGLTVVQAFNHQRRAQASFDTVNEELCECAEMADRESGAVPPYTKLVNNLAYIAAAVVGCLFAIGGTISIGNVQAMLQYAGNFSEPFLTVAEMTGSFSAAKAAARRIFALLDTEEEIPDPAAPKVPKAHTGTVEFKHVAFGYTADKLLMKDVNISVKPGQKVAVVGPTGAGKTTLINLLMRFYEISGGSITVDGVDTREMTREELRNRFGMVLQDTWLFKGTIMDNLGYGGTDIPEERILKASETACTDKFIRTLPGDYQMVLEKGAENISQGERQMLTIARAMATDPEIMILDEATSNVDTHTEVTIQAAMKKLMQGRTSFVIAHRLSTIQDADVILYMEQGDIKEFGTHEELLKLGGKYAALYYSQFA